MLGLHTRQGIRWRESFLTPLARPLVRLNPLPGPMTSRFGDTSLPGADSGTRGLLTGLAARVSDASAKVVLHDKRPEVQARWKAFLGPNLRIVSQWLG